ncbi:hypothetical protein Tco_0449107 [Tanacetum coccineum]
MMRGDSKKEDESAQDCFVLPIWPSYSSTITPVLKTADKREDTREEEQVFMDELERLKMQEHEANEEAEALRKKFEQETENFVIQEGAAKTSSTNIFSTVSTPAKANSTNLVNTVSIPISTASPNEGLSLFEPTNPEEDDSEIPPFEDIYQNSSDAHAFVSYVQKQRRNNHKDFQHCLFACFLSQNEPKKISDALEDESWVDAMQEELLQFKIQKVWVFIDLPYGKKAIGTKWVYRNKKDERGVVVRNKARSQYPQLVYKVVKALYGLHQATGSLVYDCLLNVLTAFLGLQLCTKGKKQTGSLVPRVLSFDLESYSICDYDGANLAGNPSIGEADMLLLQAVVGQHNMVAYLEKSEGNAEFHKIIDFLKRSSIHHALTVHYCKELESLSLSLRHHKKCLLFDDADGTRLITLIRLYLIAISI